MKKRKTRKRKQKLALAQVVKAAQEVGAKVTVSLEPIKPERPRLALKSGEWPGWAGNRSIMADLDYDEKDVARVFKDNPSSLWVITPYEIIERAKFFAPKPAPSPVGVQSTEKDQSTANPS